MDCNTATATSAKLINFRMDGIFVVFESKSRYRDICESYWQLLIFQFAPPRDQSIVWLEHEQTGGVQVHSARDAVANARLQM